MKSVVITGVSTGIGHGIAKVFVSNGIKVFGSVRNQKDAEALTKELGNLFTPLIFDVTDEEKVKAAASYVREKLKGQKLWGLINNAGISKACPLFHMPIDDFKRILEVNLVGVLIVTKAFLPLLGIDQTLKGEPGRIINIGSTSGKIAQPFNGPYAISKHGLEGFTDSLRRELMLFGIDVILIRPGLVKTEIFRKGFSSGIPEEIKNSPYYNSFSEANNYTMNVRLKKALEPDFVGKLVFHVMQMKHPKKTRYAPFTRQTLNFILLNILPKRWVDKLVAKKLGLLKK